MTHYVVPSDGIMVSKPSQDLGTVFIQTDTSSMSSQLDPNISEFFMLPIENIIFKMK